ncbi:MAG: chitin deacetylase family protein [Cyanobacteria bacterium P01_D01_bin.105]
MRLRYSLIPTFLTITALYLLSQPNWIFALATTLYPGAIYNVQVEAFPVRPPIVALTIDDGPGPHTEAILAMLARHDAKATFFPISGHLPGYESTLAQAVQTGHELGNHLTADRASVRLPSDEFEADLRAAEAALSPFLTKTSQPDMRLCWLRPGMGFYTPQMVDIARRYGYHLVLGSNFPYDTHVASPRFASSFILNTVQPGDIIVLHDGQGENAARGDRTLQTLSIILPILKSRGYIVTTLSELTATADATVKIYTADDKTADDETTCIPSIHAGQRYNYH